MDTTEIETIDTPDTTVVEIELKTPTVKDQIVGAAIGVGFTLAVTAVGVGIRYGASIVSSKLESRRLAKADKLAQTSPEDPKEDN